MCVVVLARVGCVARDKLFNFMDAVSEISCHSILLVGQRMHVRQLQRATTNAKGIAVTLKSTENVHWNSLECVRNEFVWKKATRPPNVCEWQP